MVDLALDAGSSLHGGGDVGLAAEPGEQAISCRVVTGERRGPVGAQHGPERGGGANHLAEALLHQGVGGFGECVDVVFGDGAAGEDVFYTPAAAPSAAPAAEPVLVVEEGTPASVDSVLREILEAEVASHLETVDAWIASARQAPEPASEALLRAIHTMNGAFAMTDVPEITGVTGAAETFVKRSLAASRVPDAEAVDALAAMADAIRRCIRALQAESPRIPRFTALAERLRTLSESLPEARWPQVAEPETAAADGSVRVHIRRPCDDQAAA